MKREEKELHKNRKRVIAREKRIESEKEKKWEEIERSKMREKE